MTTLRIATLNIWHNRGPWPQRLRLIRNEIERLEPAVIGLQEVLRNRDVGGVGPASVASPETCQATEIAQGLGYTVAYGPACDFSETHHHGNALLSRLPIRRVGVFGLPGADTAEPRSLLFALIETQCGDLPVFVTHLSWEPHHASIRDAQVRFIAAKIDELTSVDDSILPAILVGDFNAEPDSDELRHLRGVDGQNGSFVDAWSHAADGGGGGADGSAGATFDTANDYARAAEEPSCRIDYILVRRREDLRRCRPVHAELAFTTSEPWHDTRVWPSDHFGVLTDVMLARREG